MDVDRDEAVPVLQLPYCHERLARAYPYGVRGVDATRIKPAMSRHQIQRRSKQASLKLREAELTALQDWRSGVQRSSDRWACNQADLAITEPAKNVHRIPETDETRIAHKYAGRMFPPGSPPSWSFCEITSVKLYVKPLPWLKMLLTSVDSVSEASTVPSSVGPEPSWISCRKTMSGNKSECVMWPATCGIVVELGAKLSTCQCM